MSDDGRLVSGGRRRDDLENVALRPQFLRELVGQDRVRENLQIIIDAAAQPCSARAGFGQTSRLCDRQR
jgi:Holliday junction resolvasome RuvABC ATP-dependent DNA helicase subunit